MGLIENANAQFMLLAGFIIAIGLVITTVMLNNIIFEGNMAGEAGADPLKYDVVNLMAISADEMKSAYRNATNASGVGKENMIANFTNQTQNFSVNLPKIYALHGEGVNVSWDTSNWNNSHYANFTDNGTASGGVNWTVVYGVSNVTNFTLYNVNGTFVIKAINQTNYEIWNLTANSSVPNVLAPQYNFTNKTNAQIYSIGFENGNAAWGGYYINGTANNKNFIRARDYILNATVTLSTSRMRANITIPVSVPW